MNQDVACPHIDVRHMNQEKLHDQVLLDRKSLLLFCLHAYRNKQLNQYPFKFGIRFISSCIRSDEWTSAASFGSVAAAAAAGCVNILYHYIHSVHHISS